MSTHKDEKNGTWYVMVRYHDWKGVKRKKCKRGFATRREEQEWERNFQLQTDGDPDMTFEAFMELYENDMRPRLKENTWLSKKHMIRTKLFAMLLLELIPLKVYIIICQIQCIHNIVLVRTCEYRS